MVELAEEAVALKVKGKVFVRKLFGVAECLLSRVLTVGGASVSAVVAGAPA